MRRSVEKALKHWQQQGLLSEEKARELRASLERADSVGAVRIFATIGAVLVGLGVILFVASNWVFMGPVSRVVVLFLGYAIVVVGAVVAERRGLLRVAEAVWLLATLMVGANIFLLAQLYNHSLTYWQGPFLWMIGALAMAVARQSRAQVALAVPLGLLALGWAGGGAGWFFDDQVQFLMSSGGLRPILPIIGIGLVCLSVLLARTDRLGFAGGPCFQWGTPLIALPFIIGTTHIEVMEWLFGIDLSVKQILVLVAAGVVLGLSLAAGAFQSRLGRPVLSGTAVLSVLLIVPVAGQPWLTRHGLLYALYVIAIFALALLSVWIGIRARDSRLINVGMFSAAVLILIQYFSWSFKLLDRSLVFIFGGILLIGLSIFLEKKRRALVSEIASSGGGA